MRRAVSIFALGAAVLGGSTARASDPREQQLAQALFDEARTLMEQKRYADACPKLAESQRLDPGGGTLLNLAVCHEKERKVATANAEYGEALGIAVRDGRKDREDLARERIRATDALVPRVSIVVPASADVEGLEVKLDGFVLRRAAWGVAAPVDPGVHRVEVSAPGRQAWSASIPVEEKERKELQVPPLAPLAAGQSAMTVAPPSAPPMFIGEPPPASGAWEPGHANPAFFVTVAIGGAALVTSGLLGVLALDANGTAKDGCTPARNFCKDQASLDAAQRAPTLAWASTGALAVAAVAGIALLLIPPRVHGRAAPQIGVAPVAGGAALDLRARF